MDQSLPHSKFGEVLRLRGQWMWLKERRMWSVQNKSGKYHGKIEISTSIMK